MGRRSAEVSWKFSIDTDGRVVYDLDIDGERITMRFRKEDFEVLAEDHCKILGGCMYLPQHDEDSEL